jgi:hypothetical protein
MLKLAIKAASKEPAESMVERGQRPALVRIYLARDQAYG